MNKKLKEYGTRIERVFTITLLVSPDHILSHNSDCIFREIKERAIAGSI